MDLPMSMNTDETRILARIIDAALAEDLGGGDLTAGAVVPPKARAAGRLVSRSAGVLCGIDAVREVFERVDRGISFKALIGDGMPLVPGAVIAEMEGGAGPLLAGERTALNFVQHLSGIATLTRSFVDAAGGFAEIFDTRKTLPGFRRLAKYAVRAGGGRNHRLGLFDQVLIKENHLSAGGLTPSQAVRKARESVPPGTMIEVEVEDLDQFRDALSAAPDVIMLDDMSLDDMRRAAAIRGGGRNPRLDTSGGVNPLLEASGGVNLENVAEVARTGVDRVSVGCLTHSVKALDIALKFRPV